MGILDVCYQAADLEIVVADFPELEDIPRTTVSLTEAVRRQRVDRGGVLSRYNCQPDCSSRRCSYKRANNTCGQRCHPTNNNCFNY